MAFNSSCDVPQHARRFRMAFVFHCCETVAANVVVSSNTDLLAHSSVHLKRNVAQLSSLWMISTGWNRGIYRLWVRIYSHVHSGCFQNPVSYCCGKRPSFPCGLSDRLLSPLKGHLHFLTHAFLSSSRQQQVQSIVKRGLYLHLHNPFTAAGRLVLTY